MARTDTNGGTPPATSPGPAWTPRRTHETGAGPYLRAVRTHWLVIVELVVVAVLAAGVYASVAPKRYQAEADLVVTPIAADDPAYVGVNVLRDSVQGSSVVTAATLATTPAVVGRAAARAHVSAAAAGGVSASPLIQSSVVAVTAQASTPQLARRLANAFAAAVVAERTGEYRASIRSVQAELAAQLQALPSPERSGAEATAIGQHLAEMAALPPGDPSIRVLSPAALPSSPAWPRPTLIVGAAFAVALMLGVGIAMAREFLTQRLTGEDELVLEQGLPVLARVPRMRKVDADGYLIRRRPLPPEVWESYRTLRVLVHATGGRRSPKTILITSAVAGEGKTMTAVNLAVTMAQAGERVVLVDGDLRRPMVASVFGAPADAPEPFRPAGYGERLSLVTGLPDEVLPEGVADAAALRRWFAGLLRRADVVVVDSAPVTAVADALELVSAVDSVLLAVRIGLTRRDRLDDARRILQLRGVSPAGVVLTTRARGHDYGDEVRRAVPAEALGPVGGNRYGAVPVAAVGNGHRTPPAAFSGGPPDAGGDRA